MIRLALLLPTNKPTVFYDVFLKSVHNLLDAKEQIIISINFQSPWTIKQIEEVVRYMHGLGLNLVYSYNQYYSPNKAEIPFNRIRYDCATQIEEDIDYYGLCDDDFLFDVGSGKMLNRIIKKLDDDKTIGLIQCRRKSRFVPFEEVDINPKAHIYFTDCGFFFRKIKGLTVFPEDALNNLGAGEEYVIGNAIVDKGYKVKLYLQSEINHLLNYGNLRNKDWMQKEIVYAPLGNLTYIKKYEIYNNKEVL